MAIDPLEALPLEIVDMQGGFTLVQAIEVPDQALDADWPGDSAATETPDTVQASAGGETLTEAGDTT